MEFSSYAEARSETIIEIAAILVSIICLPFTKIKSHAYGMAVLYSQYVPSTSRLCFGIRI